MSSRSLLLLLLVVSLLFSVSLSEHQKAEHSEADDHLEDIELNHHLERAVSEADILSDSSEADDARFAVQGSNRSQPVYNDTVVRRMSETAFSP